MTEYVGFNHLETIYDGISAIVTILELNSYDLCLAKCRADHKCLSLKYIDAVNAFGNRDNCILFVTIPHHIPEQEKTILDRGWRTAVMQCGKNLSFLRHYKYQ